MIWKSATQRWSVATSFFAVFPVQMSDGTWVWWQHYWGRLDRNLQGNHVWRYALTLTELERSAPKGPPPLPPRR